MIEKILRLKNIARFHDEGYGDFSLGEFNLVYAENGNGKTTLSAIMHSIAKDEPGFIQERATVNRGGSPEAKILTASKDQLHFDGGSWSGPTDSTKIDVFDSHFVNRNVYSGHTLSHEHKKKLHRFVIGSKGNDISRRIDRLDSLSRGLARHINEIEQDINRCIESDYLTVDEFLNLPDPEDVGEKIKTISSLVDDLKKADEIQEKKSLEEPSLPEIPIEEIKTLLGKTLTDVSEGAESKVEEHLSQCMDGGDEEWIKTGMSFLQDEECPFCGQDLKGVDLIEAYRGYFSEEYNSLKSSVEALFRQVTSKILPENGWHSVDSVFDQNQSRYDFWKQRIDGSHEIPSELREQGEEVWNDLRRVLSSLLQKKKTAPLEPVEFGDEEQEALDAYQSLCEQLETYAEEVSEVNEKIESFKSELESGSRTEAEEKLARLKDCRTRHNEIGRDLSKRLRLNRSRKEKIKEAKENAKEQLEDYQQNVLDSCQEGINEFLFRAGADFRIRDAKVSYLGGTANARFSIEINQKEIGLGNAVTEVGEQSFRNLLSSGDKTTLAFAFFYARIRELPDLDNRTIVIDDPISSLDQHRRDATRNAILELADSAKQVIVLSHSPRFIWSVWQECDDDSTPHIFKIQRTGDKTSSLSEWEKAKLERKLQDPYFHDFERLIAYKENREGDPERVAKSIRPVLEGNLRRRFADHYGREDGSVGAFIGKVENANDDNPLSDLRDTDYLDELDKIRKSAYCHDPHHDDDPFLPEQINENELATWVKRTIKLCRGLPGISF